MIVFVLCSRCVCVVVVRSRCDRAFRTLTLCSCLLCAHVVIMFVRCVCVLVVRIVFVLAVRSRCDRACVLVVRIVFVLAVRSRCARACSVLALCLCLY